MPRTGVHLEVTPGKPHGSSVHELDVRCHRRAPAPERSRHCLQREPYVIGYPVARHHALCEGVLACHPLGVVLKTRPQTRDGGNLGSGGAGQHAGEADVVHVLVGEDDSLDLFDLPAQRAKPFAERLECQSRVGTGIDESQGVVFDQVEVDRADQERGWDRDAVNAGACRVCRGRKFRVPAPAHPRMISSTSSRLASMSSSETSDSRQRRSSGSVLEARTLKCQSSKSTLTPSMWLISAPRAA